MNRLITGVFKRSLGIEDFRFGKLSMARSPSDGRQLIVLVDLDHEKAVEVLKLIEENPLPQGVKIFTCDSLPTLVQDRSERSYSSGGGGRSYGSGGGRSSYQGGGGRSYGGGGGSSRSSYQGGGGGDRGGSSYGSGGGGSYQGAGGGGGGRSYSRDSSSSNSGGGSGKSWQRST